MMKSGKIRIEPGEETDANAPDADNKSQVSASELSDGRRAARQSILRRGSMRFIRTTGSSYAMDGSESRHAKVILDEAEVLPYESVFDWDIVDRLGFYSQIEKYNDLKMEYHMHDEKLACLDNMWNDLEKYQCLRRFHWPPKQHLGWFYSRGYYEDYNIDCHALNNLAVLADDLRRREEFRLMKTPARVAAMEEMLQRVWNRDKKSVVAIQDPITGEVKKKRNRVRVHKDLPEAVISDQKNSLSEFSPAHYDRLVLHILSIPPGTPQKAIELMFPEGKVEMKEIHKGQEGAEITFESFAAADKAFKCTHLLEIEGHPIALIPKRKGETTENLFVPDDETESFETRDPWLIEWETDPNTGKKKKKGKGGGPGPSTRRTGK